MALELNTECSICGTKYHTCTTCSEITHLKPWRSVTDTIEHYKIYLAIHGYTISKNKESAKKELESCDLTDLENFNPEIKSVIKDIMGEPKKKIVSKTDKQVNDIKVNEKIETKENDIIE